MKNIIKNTALILSSLLFTALLLLIGEAVVRVTMDIPTLGNSTNLFIPNAFGESIGNTKNAEAMSFGVKVYTDVNGFRVGRDHHLKKPHQQDKKILVLGDSVGFGSGVEFQDTFVGRFIDKNPNINVYNTSVIGYTTNDYKNVTDEFLLARVNEINAVFLIFCLNDISHLSATNINTAVMKKNSNGLEAERSTAEHPSETYRSRGASNLKQWRLATLVNEYLRSRSMLYVLVKGMATDPQARYWEADLRSYRELTDGGLAKALEPIRYIANVLRRHNILFTVIVSPYEYQVRVNDNNTILPQEMLGKYFDTNKIRHVDALPLFKQQPVDTGALFLPYDPMHLSSQGNTLLYEIIRGIFMRDMAATVDPG